MLQTQPTLPYKTKKRGPDPEEQQVYWKAQQERWDQLHVRGGSWTLEAGSQRGQIWVGEQSWIREGKEEKVQINVSILMLEVLDQSKKLCFLVRNVFLALR